jgi:hypothetical protein
MSLEITPNEMDSLYSDLQRSHAEQRRTLLKVAASLHFALVHDEAENGVFGSLTGTRVSNAWTHLPEDIRKKFPPIRELGAAVKKGEKTWSGPMPLTELLKGE